MTAKKPLVGLYPGTFDPITKGHQDIIQRATRVVDRLVIAVAVNAGKEPLFSPEERVEMVRAEAVMHLAQDVGARIIVRGLRAVSDFEYEFQMASMNARLNPEVETVFLTASERQQFIASRFVKEIGRLGGDITSFVSPRVAERLAERFAQERAAAAAGGKTLHKIRSV
jgi:pantetheine-phosphate adenylyltransferase